MFATGLSITNLAFILEKTKVNANCLAQLTALQVIKKINARLRFLYMKKRFLSQPLHRLLCNAIIQPHLDYGIADRIQFCLKHFLDILLLYTAAIKESVAIQYFYLFRLLTQEKLTKF